MDLLLLADQKVELGWICGPEGLREPQEPCSWTWEKVEGGWKYRLFRSKDIREMVIVNPELRGAPWLDRIHHLNRDRFLLLLLYRETDVKIGHSRGEAFVQKLSVGTAAYILCLSISYEASYMDELESRVEEMVRTKWRDVRDGKNPEIFGKFVKFSYHGKLEKKNGSMHEAYKEALKYILGTDSAHVPILAHISTPPSVLETRNVTGTNQQQGCDRRSTHKYPELTEEGPITRSRTKRHALNSDHEAHCAPGFSIKQGTSGPEATQGLCQPPYQTTTPRITVDQKLTPKSEDIPRTVALSAHHTREDILPQVHTSKTGNRDSTMLSPPMTTSSGSAVSCTYKECRELLKSIDTNYADQSSEALESSSSNVMQPYPGTNAGISYANRPALSSDRDTRYSNTPVSRTDAPERANKAFSYTDEARCLSGTTSCTVVTTTSSNSSAATLGTNSFEPAGTAASASGTRTISSDRDNRMGISSRHDETNNRTSKSSSSVRAATSTCGTSTTNSVEEIRTTIAAAGVEPTSSAPRTFTSTSVSLKSKLLQSLTPTSSCSAKEDECGIQRKTFGIVSSATRSKTVLLLGAKGSGKTCLVNAVANFIYGIKSDSEKLTVSDEIAEAGFSTTENITGYTFVFKDQEEDVALTLIDTPGMNDSSGNEVRDHVDSLKTFLANAAHKGLEIHCIAFVAQAHLVRLTSSERLVMDNLKTLFGQDVSGHMVNLITFADNQSKPPVVEALDHYGMSTRHCFNFNNSVFCGSSEESEKELDKVYWKTSNKNWKKCWKVVRDISPLKTNTMKSIQKELYATNVRDSILRELQAEVKSLQRIYRGCYNKQVEEGRRQVWDVAHVVFRSLQTTDRGSHHSVWSLIEDTVHQSCDSKQARKITEFLKVGASMPLKEAMVVMLKSNIDLQNQLMKVECKARYDLAQRGRKHGAMDTLFGSSDPQIDTEDFLSTKRLVIRSTAEALNRLIKDHSNNSMVPGGVVKYLDSFEGEEIDPNLCAMIKEIRNHLCS